MAPDLSSKRLQLLKEVVPTLSLVTVLSHLTDPIGPLQVQELGSRPAGWCRSCG